MVMSKGVILGHYISAVGIQVDLEKIEVILLLSTPCTQTEVCSIIGYAGYYRRFINIFSQIVVPLYALTGNVEFKWFDKCDTDFTYLKRLVSMAPVLPGPNWEIPFQVSSDGSDTMIRSILGQEEDKKPYAIYYISKNLTCVELNYIVIEKEFLALIYSINKFRDYII